MGGFGFTIGLKVIAMAFTVNHILPPPPPEPDVIYHPASFSLPRSIL